MSSNGTAFVVDDDPGVLKSMRWLLESTGLRVEAFSSAAEFLKCYDRSKPGCLILDVSMPGMTGPELQEKLDRQGKSLPIIFLTAHGDVPTCARTMKKGAVDFIEKPVENEEFLNLVRQAIKDDLQRHRCEKEEPELKLRIDSLTRREREVMDLLYCGNPTKHIGARLGIGYQTAAKHRASVLEKLGVENEAELVRLLVHHGLRPS